MSNISQAGVQRVPTQAGTAIPAGGALTIIGAGGITTSAAGSTVTVTGIGAMAVESLTGNSGGAVGPTGNNINVVGDGTSITIAGNPGTSTLTAKVTGTTNHSLLTGNAGGTFNNLGVATNGQLPIGSAGADPVLATLTAGTGISVTNGAGSITIAATGTTTLNYTLVNSSPYVVLTTDDFLGVDSSGGPITVKLPNAPTTGSTWVIKDITGSAASNAITVTTVGGVVLIDGSTSFAMNTNFESITVLFSGSAYYVF